MKRSAPRTARGPVRRFVASLLALAIAGAASAGCTSEPSGGDATARAASCVTPDTVDYPTCGSVQQCGELVALTRDFGVQPVGAATDFPVGTYVLTGLKLHMTGPIPPGSVAMTMRLAAGGIAEAITSYGGDMLPPARSSGTYRIEAGGLVFETTCPPPSDAGTSAGPPRTFDFDGNKLTVYTPASPARGAATTQVWELVR